MSQVLPVTVAEHGGTAETNPIARTAYYTLAVRAWDASRAKPVCGDRYAAAFMNEEAAAIWERFKDLAKPNGSNATRHAIIDEHLREELAKDRTARVVVIGAGFDTRAYRLDGGHWIEVDEPAIIRYKEERLPAERAPNPLTRVPIRFARDALADVLARFTARERTHIVLEGVLMYLTRPQRVELLHALRACFPRHVVYCDLMRRSFYTSYARAVQERMARMGAAFHDMVEDPEALFVEAGYQAAACTSIALTAAERGAVGIPPFVIRRFLRTLRDGYSIWKWERRAP
ncbi:MAG TPA: class I SAM-dependent methyltransferase, partial [Burkholderiales bacterium]